MQRRYLLTAAGIAPTEEDVYRHLLTEGAKTVEEVALSMGQPAVAVEDALDRLEHLNFVIRQDSNFAAVDPELALHLWATQTERNLLEQLGAVRRLALDAPGVHRSLHPQDPARDTPIRQVSVADVAHHRQATVELARDHLRAVVTHAAHVQLRTPTSLAPKRQVIYRRRVMEDEEEFTNVTQLDLSGAEVRMLPAPPTAIVIADSDLGFVDLGPYGGMIVFPSLLLDLLIDSFDGMWAKAMPLGSNAHLSTVWQLSEDQRDLLRLLSTGMKDQVIARTLGIGLRTVVRRVGLLAAALDAETRFQMGVQAKARGFL